MSRGMPGVSEILLAVLSSRLVGGFACAREQAHVVRSLIALWMTTVRPAYGVEAMPLVATARCLRNACGSL